MLMKKFLKCTTPLMTILLILMVIAPVLAQEEDDPVIFIVGEGSMYMHGSGWYAGYAIYGCSGTYILNISATGSPGHYPIINVKVIALASDEAAGGELKSLTIEGMPIFGFQTGKPPYYTANGGPFQEPDYYGYNDTYVIPQLTYDEAHHPEHWKQITITVEFQPTATTNSKIMFLCYGTDNKGQPAETPFSGGTMFTIPELASTIIGFTTMIGATGVYRLRRYRKTKNSKN